MSRFMAADDDVHAATITTVQYELIMMLDLVKGHSHAGQGKEPAKLFAGSAGGRFIMSLAAARLL
jgi:hypothetical protein